MHQTHLACSWKIHRFTKYFVFTVLLFSSLSTTIVFTKILHPLFKYWHTHAMKIACFLDDVLGITYNYNKDLVIFEFLESSLLKSSFVPNNKNKS